MAMAAAPRSSAARVDSSAVRRGARPLPARQGGKRPPVQVASQRSAAKRVAKPRGPSEDNCYAYCLAENVDLTKLKKALSFGSDQLLEEIPEDQTIVCAVPLDKDYLCQVKIREKAVGRPQGFKDCYVFAFGSIVFWACTQEEVQRAREELQPFLLKPLDKKDVDEDHISLRPDDGQLEKVGIDMKHPTERITLAYGLAQSVRLGSFELMVERTISQSIPSTLVRTGAFNAVNVSKEELKKLQAEVCLIWYLVNLGTDILDTEPEVLWSHDDLGPLYLKLRASLDIDERVDILNHRLEVLKELGITLDEEHNQRTDNWLFWVIIILVAVDACLMACRLIMTYWNSSAGGGSDKPQQGSCDFLELPSKSLFPRRPALRLLCRCINGIVIKPFQHVQMLMAAVA